MVWGFVLPCGALHFQAVVGCRVGQCVCVVGPRVGLLYCCNFLFLYLFPCAWVRPIDLLLCDLIVHRCRLSGGALPCLNVNTGRFDYKKKKKKKLVLKAVVVLARNVQMKALTSTVGGFSHMSE